MIRSYDTPRAALEGLEARFGALLASRLNERAAQVPNDISERLRVSRERAVAVARQSTVRAVASKPASVGLSRGGVGILGQGGGFWLGLASWVPLAVLVAGLVLIQQWNLREQVLAAAEIDAVLLADDLPPDAWMDPGFREYLKAPRP